MKDRADRLVLLAQGALAGMLADLDEKATKDYVLGRLTRAEFNAHIGEAVAEVAIATDKALWKKSARGFRAGVECGATATATQSEVQKVTMVLTVIESPYAGDVERNLRYARACLRDSISRGESPYASHLFFTQVLDDNVPEMRKLGIAAGFAWAANANYRRAVYGDRGVSAGMRLGIEQAMQYGQEIVYRSIPGWELWDEKAKF